jgi:hypothetical protein
MALITSYVRAYLRMLAGGSPAATHFFLLRQEKVSKKKATADSPVGCWGYAPAQFTHRRKWETDANSLRSNSIRF